MNCNELSSLISRNSDSIAFLVGNGIHHYVDAPISKGKMLFFESLGFKIIEVDIKTIYEDCVVANFKTLMTRKKL